MSPLILLQTMLVLLAMMAAGFALRRIGVITAGGRKQLVRLVVHVLSPMLMLSTLSNYDPAEIGSLVTQNLWMILLVYGFLVAAGIVFVRVLRLKPDRAGFYSLMITFGNSGFMGIPVVRVVVGDQYVVYMVFWLLIWNVLAYTYGVYLAVRMRGTKEGDFRLRRLLNAGTIAAAAAIVIFFLRIRIAGPASTFFGYLGNASIPVSMLAIGASLSELGLLNVLAGKKKYLFLAVRLLAIPAAGILLLRLLPFETHILQIGCIELCMPIANIAGMFAEEYGNSGYEANQLIALSTVLSVVTVPLLSLLY